MFVAASRRARVSIGHDPTREYDELLLHPSCHRQPFAKCSEHGNPPRPASPGAFVQPAETWPEQARAELAWSRLRPTSLHLPNASTLWLFGDTLVSGFAGGHRTAAGCAMPHQTVALQPDRQAPLQFSWRENKTSGEPLNFFWPQSSLERAVPCSDPFSETSSYWWVVAGIESSSAGLAPGRLLLLAERVQGTPGQGLGFKVLGTSVIVVDNAADNPVQWSHRSVSLNTCGTASCETWSAGIVPAHGCGVDCVYLVGSTGPPSSGRGHSPCYAGHFKRCSSFASTRSSCSAMTASGGRGMAARNQLPLVRSSRSSRRSHSISHRTSTGGLSQRWTALAGSTCSSGLHQAMT